MHSTACFLSKASFSSCTDLITGSQKQPESYSVIEKCISASRHHRLQHGISKPLLWVLIVALAGGCFIFRVDQRIIKSVIINASACFSHPLAGISHQHAEQVCYINGHYLAMPHFVRLCQLWLFWKRMGEERKYISDGSEKVKITFLLRSKIF